MPALFNYSMPNRIVNTEALLRCGPKHGLCFGPCFGTEAVLRSVLRSLFLFRVRVHVRVRVSQTTVQNLPKQINMSKQCFGLCFDTLLSVLWFFFGTLWSVLCLRVKVNDKRLHRHSTVARQKAASLTAVWLLHSLTRKVSPKTFRQNLQNSISVTKQAYLNHQCITHTENGVTVSKCHWDWDRIVCSLCIVMCTLSL